VWRIVRSPSRGTVAGTVISLLIVLMLAVGAAVGGFVTARALRAERVSPPASSANVPSKPPVLASATASPTATPTTSAPAPSAVGVERALSPALADPRLGGRLLAEVADGLSGSVLLDRQADQPAAPASTAKLATAAALLAVRAGTDRLTTRVVAGATPGSVVLVGGGDPTLSAADPGEATAYPDAARVSDLAAAVRRTGVTVGTIVVDGSLFTGPAISPDWQPLDVPSPYAAPITALTIDGGRAAPTALVRSRQPDVAAGRALAVALGVPGAAVVLGTAPQGAARLAEVRSAPMAELVRQMLQQSDNVIAETLARQVAIAKHQPPSFAGAVAGIGSVLRGLGVDIGDGLVDASGLAENDRMSPAALVGVLHLTTSAGHPRMAGLVDALPVAGWEGTLASRYLHGAAGAGLVRAKTGTLTSVSTLAGVVQDRDGRLLVFALVADEVGAKPADTVAAEAALDAVTSALADCGCR
jgi:serine-type D-Ala-D-Ala carboxypeptidase/endopeptidase (penicillin-binding protein 4)